MRQQPTDLTNLYTETYADDRIGRGGKLFVVFK
jgi:hypothetical protein